MRNLFLILLAGMTVCSCVTPKEKLIKNVHVGMLKDEVLEAAGNPTTFLRSQGHDRWIYKVVKDSDINVTEVQFLNGKVTYVGPPPTPSLSAEEQDKYNDLYNHRQDETEAKIWEERRKRRKAAHPEENDDEQ